MKTKIYDYHIWDAREINEKIKKKMVDVIITSPPYWNLKDYKVKNQLGYEQEYEKYLDDLKDIFEYCSKIVNDTGSLWIIADTFKKNGEIKPFPFDLAKRIDNKWKLQDIIIWNKDKTRPWSGKGKLRNIFEYVLFFTKIDASNFKYEVDRIKDPDSLKKWWVKYPERYNPKGKTPARVWNIPIPTQGSWSNGWVHFCPFPPELIKRLLLLTTDEGYVVLDPFAGSGSVLAMAKVMKRKPIGFDLNPEYKQMYEEKVFPAVQEIWKTQFRKEIKRQEKARNEFSSKILKLRQLKYPKTLVKELLKNRKEKDLTNLPINSVFIFPKDISNNEYNKKHKFIGSNIYLIFESEINKDELNNEIKKISNKPPLSKFGISSDVYICQKDKFYKKKMNPENLAEIWIYANGITNLATQKIDFNKWNIMSDSEIWASYFKNDCPPILSSIYINQPIPEK